MRNTSKTACVLLRLRLDLTNQRDFLLAVGGVENGVFACFIADEVDQMQDLSNTQTFSRIETEKLYAMLNIVPV